ncbi:Josephin-domain-containing protein [Peniophora sp. CONT]|nr:Josephin-domain-containing protein [Peniophora sp. CONT]
MAFTIESLIPLIHHEKQERGSMLCAQHALNALLQEPIFSVTDLAQIAKSLDDLEDTYNEDRGLDSVNMDDSGFFSVQVLEKALDVWGLSLPRWASEEMKEYRDHPETQLGFVLNHQQHWFALRRFGNLSPDPYEPATNSHWFNLNSYLPKPEWVGNAYLGALLAQAQQDGYSIFAVVQKDTAAPLALPKTDADRLAENVPPPNAAATPRNATTSIHPATDMPEGMEDEDYELQAAIAASMGGEFSIPPELVSSGAGPSAAPAPAPARTQPRAASSIPGGYPPGLGHPEPMDEDEDDEDDLEDIATLDPVEASRRRNERLLAQFQRAQGDAVREMGFDETARQRQLEREAEEAEFQRVLAESEALAREQGHFESPPAGSGAATPAPAPARNAPRVYDDEDEELQAALRASLESVPADFVMPASPRAQRPAPPPALARQPSAQSVDNDDAMTEASVATEPESEPEPQQQELTPEEMRRRRLAALEKRAAGGGG